MIKKLLSFFVLFLFLFNNTKILSFTSTESPISGIDIDKNLDYEAEVLYKKIIKNLINKDYYLVLDDIDKISNEYYYTKYYNFCAPIKAFVLFTQKRYDELSFFADYYIDTNLNDEKNNAYLTYLELMSNYLRIKRINSHKKYMLGANKYILIMKDRYSKTKYIESVKEIEKKIRKMLFYSDLDIAYTYQKSRNYIPAIKRYYKILQQYKDIIKKDASIESKIENNLRYSFQKIGIDLTIDKDLL